MNLKTLQNSLFVLVVVGASSALAQETPKEGSLQLNQSTSEDTTITIKKGPIENETRSAVAYEIISGTDELSSDEEFDHKKALDNWKEACADWKKEIKELNRENQILSINCGSKEKIKEGSKYIYKSQATYKMRVKIVETNKSR